MKKYYEILKDLREDHDYTQGQIAEILNTSQSHIWRYESGKTEIPVRHLKTLCMLYEVSADYILGLPKGLHWPR